MLEFKSAIVDELGTIIVWCSDVSENKIKEILNTHPEWTLKCIQIGGGY